MKVFVFSETSYTETMKHRTHRGFTVLELLVILGIITILVGLVLVSLNAARRHSVDERKVANAKTVALGLQQYFSICRQYPATLTGTEDCPALSLQVPPKTIADIIPEAVALGFNAPGSKYHYISLVDTMNPDRSSCTNFHLWVELESEGLSFQNQKSGILSSDYSSMGLMTCDRNAGAPVVPPTDQLFDIKK